MPYVKRGGNGGRRVGAGAKAADGVVIVVEVTVRLDQESADMLDDMEGVNTSVKIRALLKELRELRLGVSPAKLKSISKPARKPFVPEQASPRFPDGRKRSLTNLLQHEAEVRERNRVALRAYNT